jgi:beta-glucosidase
MNNPKPEEEKEKFKELLNSGLIYEIFGKYKVPSTEYSIPEDLIADIPSSQTAILVIGRGSGGEECDRRIEEDYYLTPSEKELLHKVASHFEQVVSVLNINGFVDLKLITSYSSICSILFLGTAGEQGSAALAEIITGRVTPSGKLPSTIAYSYDDYPSSDLFFTNKDKPETILTYEDFGLSSKENNSIDFKKSPVALYKEGIYVGYRYFDTFHIPVMFPFGHGLSYAEFSFGEFFAQKDKGNIIVKTNVKNQSNIYSGKEVAQLYVSAPSGRLEKPYQELLTYVKTKELSPNETEEITLSFSIADMASYDEDIASYILEEGLYYIRVGNSSRNTRIVGYIQVTDTIVTKQLTNKIGLSPANKDKINFLSNKGITPYSYPGEEEEQQKAICLLDLNQADFTSSNSAFTKKVKSSHSTVATSALDTNTENHKNYTLKDVKAGVISLEGLVETFTVEELAVLLNGYGPGLPFGGMGGIYSSTIQYEDGSDIAVSTHPTGFPGYISPGLSKYGIPSVFYKDGPAGVSKIAWPTGFSMACTFNSELLKDFGKACASESVELQVDSWLAPGINIQRNPIGGRNFEYYSEDPRHTGICGLSLALGAEEMGITTCPKHFALNEQETYRRGSTKNSFDALDSIVEERAAREIYLKPFEMVVKNCGVSTIMTSFNKVNGKFAAGNKELCVDILREEWGYNGIVVTDWGDMDIVIDGADAIASGNDIIMPGGPPVINQVLDGYKEGRVTLTELKKSAIRFLTFVMNSNSCKTYWEEN